MRGGTQIVRGILDAARAAPLVHRGAVEAREGAAADAPAAAPVDVKEYNRGRTIGNIERLLMLILVVLGSYEGLALLVAAKGLIRAKELEERDFAEYFIVGSLSSVAVALIVGIPLRPLLAYLWQH